MSFISLWLIITVRYFFFGIFFWYFFYRSSIFRFTERSLFKSPADAKQQIYEIQYSLLSTLIFTVVGWGLYFLWQSGWTQIEEWKAPQGGQWAWLLLQAAVLIFLHDTYFYWTHRLLHRKAWFKAVHFVHHVSKKTSPWSSFSFHPIESVMNALILPILFMVVPVHPYVVLWHLSLMTLTGVTNHLGIEIMPNLFFKWQGHRHWVTAINHGHHHLQYHYNFGLFLTFWDHMMGTLSEEALNKSELIKNSSGYK